MLLWVLESGPVDTKAEAFTAVVESRVNLNDFLEWEVKHGYTVVSLYLYLQQINLWFLSQCLYLQELCSLTSHLSTLQENECHVQNGQDHMTSVANKTKAWTANGHRNEQRLSYQTITQWNFKSKTTSTARPLRRQC